MAKARKTKRLAEGFWRMSNGRYLMDVRDQDGKRIRKTWKDREQARKERARIVHEIATEKYVNPNAEYATFAQFVEVFHDKYTNPTTGRKPRTDDYRVHAKALLPFFGELPVSDTCNPARWGRASDAFLEARHAAGVRKRTEKNLRALQTMLNFAVRLGYVTINPLKAAKVVIPNEPKQGRLDYFTEGELGRLLDASPAWLVPLVRFAVATGFRRKEVTGLRWTDVDFNASRIWTNRDSKTGREDSVRMGNEARAVLQEQQKARMRTGVRSEFVFTDDAGLDYHAKYRPSKDGDRQPCQNTITKAMRVVCDAIGKPGASFHVLRHTHASWAIQAGVSVVVVQRMMRHRSLDMTMKYAHLAPDQDAVGADAIDAAFAKVGHSEDTPGAERGLSC